MTKGDKAVQWKGKSRGGVLGYLIFIKLIRFFGVRAAYLLLMFVVVYFIPFSPRSTKSLWSFYRKRLGFNRFRSLIAIPKHYYRFGQTLIDKVAINNGKEKCFSFSFDNFSQFEEILKKKEGLIMIGAHVGSWEMGSLFFEEYGKKMHVVMFDAEYQKIKEVLAENSKQANYNILPIIPDSLDSILRIKSVLDKSEIVCFQGDRFMAGHPFLIHPFLGYEAKFPVGPFRIAAKLDVNVVFYYAIRESNRRYTFKFIIPEKSKVKNDNEKIYLSTYCNSLDEVVRRHPEQWFNFYEFWS